MKLAVVYFIQGEPGDEDPIIAILKTLGRPYYYRADIFPNCIQIRLVFVGFASKPGNFYHIENGVEFASLGFLDSFHKLIEAIPEQPNNVTLLMRTF